MPETETPADLVRRFCAVWPSGDVEAIVAFFNEETVYHNIPIAAVVGRDAIRTTITGFMSGTESVEFRVLNLAADGNNVLTERADVFAFPAGTIELPVMGTFEVNGGVITAWRDYFDLNQFMSQMPTT